MISVPYESPIVGLLPNGWRGPAAELLLRRPGSPGPTAEHVFQYLLSRRKVHRIPSRCRKATVTGLAHHFGVSDQVVALYREFARASDRSLAFRVGATEEVFTQCSQNLFVKRPEAPAAARQNQPPAPSELAFEDFVSRQIHLQY